MADNSTKPNRKYRTTIVIETDADPKFWDLQGFYWSIENDEGHEVSRRTVKHHDEKKEGDSK